MADAAPGKYEILGTPSPEEAAATIAAIERFLQDTTVVLPAADAGQSGWLRAALHEGVGLCDANAVW